MLDPKQILKEYNLHASPLYESPDQGLINSTWVVGKPPTHILQWVNPIFSPLIHHDLDVITRHLQHKGLITPLLTKTLSGELFCSGEEGSWRVWSFIKGSTKHNIDAPETARAAGQLVGRFHCALSDLEHQFVAPKRDIHNTPARIKDLEAALESAQGHPLEKEAVELGSDILKSWNNWDGALEQPERICHGDLKISNLRFDEEGRQGVCLIDLDTVGTGSFAVEMGDAFRSWCNRSKEDEPSKAHFDTDIFSEGVTSWIAKAPTLSAVERESIVGGIERICLELSARFCADAINNSYFKEDRSRFPQRGAHNLVRAKSQFALAQSVNEQRLQCERFIKGL